jgi:hypothetical protein
MPTCTTTDFGLAASQPENNCFAPAVTSWQYYTNDRKLVALKDAAAVPQDALLVDTPTGKKPVIVQVEHGVINRGIYTIMRADDTPGTTEANDWNKRLVYRYGGGCGTTYTQGFNLMGPADPEVFIKGYAVATSTLNTFQVECNDVVSAETTMMVKEHFIESVGLPELTIGEGGSGGAIQLYLIAQNYPGLLDAIAPLLPFPDAISISGGVVDCALLNRYYRGSQGEALTTRQQVAINGHLTAKTCDFWEQTFVPGIDPTNCGFGEAVQGVAAALPGLGSSTFPQPPKSMIYDPTTNPKGIRCTLQDSNVNVFGTDPATGFALRPWDNVGLQYGLAAMKSGSLTVDEFLTLNENIGSFDIDGKWQAARAQAPKSAVEAAYETGRVVEQAGDLLRIPILTINLYTDPQGDIHDRFRSFSIRDRLASADGTPAPNMTIWTRPLPPGKSLIDSLTGSISLGAQVIDVLDRWATALAADTSDKPIAEKLLAARPSDGVDTCFDSAGTVVKSGTDVYDGPGPCTDPYPIKADPRIVAGSPRRSDIVKCALQPVTTAISSGQYGAELSPEQQSRLEAMFPSGVCDWSKPGIGQVPIGKPWHSFGNG